MCGRFSLVSSHNLVFSCSCLDLYFLHIVIMILPLLTFWQFAKTTWCFCLTACLKLSPRLSACLPLCVCDYSLPCYAWMWRCGEVWGRWSHKAPSGTKDTMNSRALIFIHINTNKVVHNKTTHKHLFFLFFFTPPLEREDGFKALLWPSVNQDKNKWSK